MSGFVRALQKKLSEIKKAKTEKPEFNFKDRMAHCNKTLNRETTVVNPFGVKEYIYE